MFETEISLR